MSKMEQFEAYLMREELKYTRDDEREAFLLSFGGDHGSYREIIRIDDNVLQSFVGMSVKVPEGSRIDIAVAVARANYGMKIGKFELDMNDGELRYHIAVPVDGDLPSDNVLDRLVHIGIAMADRYMPAFLAVIYGNEPAKDAIALVEQTA
ncbi:YbjN domain-containing protein [Stieleria varia]|uniref:YbjN domain-containing protein n=1 Tax=Stieleria varia TaxID=2528005 RepID=A0A5C6AY75_9BACT|nr:YbjN domain-containing protein [Stieleria varia]TWU04598.1 hypothetical protein Pla52n_26400 [Stieleria varia]